MPDNPIEVAYDAFIDQVDHNLETAGVSDELQAAITAGDLVAALAAVREMARTAGGKAKLLWSGSPVGTILRNTQSGASAQRAITPEGIPLWKVSETDGSKWDSHDPVLQPESAWACIYNPEGES